MNNELDRDDMDWWRFACVFVGIVVIMAVCIWLASCQAPQSEVTPGQTQIEREERRPTRKHDTTTIIRVLPQTMNMMLLTIGLLDTQRTITVNGQEVSVGDRDVVEIERRNVLEEDMGTERAKGAATGPGLSIRSQEYEGGFDTETPTIDLGFGLRGTGGGIAWQAAWTGGQQFNMAHGLGILLVIAGGLVLVLPMTRVLPGSGYLGAGLIGLGVLVFAMAGAEPWVWSLIMLLVFAGMAGVLLWYMARTGKLTRFRQHIVHGVDSLHDIDPAAHEKVKDAIKNAAGPNDRLKVIDPEVQAAKAS